MSSDISLSASQKKPKQRQPLGQSERLKNVLYEIRGPIHTTAAQLEAAGHNILRLNIGNPATFGFPAPESIIQDIMRSLPQAHGYTESQGILPARRAVVSRYQNIPGFPSFDVHDVYLGNGVSELITLVLLALLNPGDQVLIPSPDYPLWTAMTHLAGGDAVHYRTVEENNWQPDIDDMRSKITAQTKAIVVINPNNPTGAVYTKESLAAIADLAAEHDLILLADEIYDRIVYDQTPHYNMATLAPDILCLTFNGLSKIHRVAGLRSAWLVITGPRSYAQEFIDGISLLASARLCPNAPAQYGIQAALSGSQSIDALIAPGGRLYQQRQLTWNKLNNIPGVSCVKPDGALYAFARLDPHVHPIYDDSQLVMDLLLAEKILLVQGTGFHWPHHDHLRIVFLPDVETLNTALERLGNFLSSYRQKPPAASKP